jgi:rhodanese-related sulfurtransferase
MSNGFKLIAASLLLLGLIVVFIGETSNQSTSNPALSFDDYDELVSAPVPMISPVELAEYLMQQEHHYNLVDLREKDASYQIPTSETHSLSSFLDRKIAVNETIFLYSETDAVAVQFYFLLNIRGYFKVKVLAGGARAWIDQILRPNQADIEEPQLESRQNLSEFFGGAFDQSESQSGFRKIILEKQHKKHKGC